MTRRVVIVGAGVLGLSLASELAGDPALDVTVIDRSHPGAGSTGLSVGVFTRQYLSRDDVEIRELPADIVVNAAGAWGGQVGELLEAPVEVVNERHEAYLFELPPDPSRGRSPMLMDYVPGGAEGLYFRQEGSTSSSPGRIPTTRTCSSAAASAAMG
jgi:glycine/D-amino acid oxidase-like deaminating enzyme